MKALADPNRVRIVCALEAGELCVCQIVEMLGLAPSTVSKHLSILRQARLIVDRKEGRWMYYRLPEETSTEAQGALALLRSSLASDSQILADAVRVAEIQCLDREALCRTQTKQNA
ncbi:MAG: winged helix-turn-helix transcriptional regulator [Verrucomicrobia bacterium]|nr:winged helix-turn-helix transcriptional regulator [Verrucomicrobiota bacterium]